MENDEIRRAEGESYIAYNYKSVTVGRQYSALYRDAYRAFGWQLTDESGGGKVLSFRRNRKAANKEQLNKLQADCECVFARIRQMERRKISLAALVSVLLGTLALVFSGLSAWSMVSLDHVVLFSVFSVIAIACYISPYFVYKLIRTRQEEKVQPLIEQAYDEIADLCEQAHALRK